MIPFGYLCTKSCKCCFYHFECYGFLLIKKRTLTEKSECKNYIYKNSDKCCNCNIKSSVKENLLCDKLIDRYTNTCYNENC